VPLPANRVTYTLEETDNGNLIGVHRDAERGTTDSVPIRDLLGYKLVAPGWWVQIYEWCEVQALE